MQNPLTRPTSYLNAFSTEVTPMLAGRKYILRIKDEALATHKALQPGFGTAFTVMTHIERLCSDHGGELEPHSRTVVLSSSIMDS